MPKLFMGSFRVKAKTIPSKVLVIGPCPKNQQVGGVARHVHNLKSLRRFTHSYFVDNSNNSLFPFLNMLLQIRMLSRSVDCILFNPSIYTGSILKLLICLSVVPRTCWPCIKIFFHGGNLSLLAPPLAPLVKLFLCKILANKAYCYFLTQKQLEEFRKKIGILKLKRYRNYGDEYCARLPQLGLTSSSDTKKIIFVGAMIKEKGIYELLQAFRMASSSSDIELIYVGSGGELDNLKSIVTSENLARIKFLGPLHGVDLQQAYEMADLLVLPSHDEAFPYVVIEAFCNGLPVVATKVGVLPEVIVPGENGFLVEINDPIDLSEKIKAAINPTFLNLAKLESAKTYNRSMSKEMAEMFYSSL